MPPPPPPYYMKLYETLLSQTMWPHSTLPMQCRLCRRLAGVSPSISSKVSLSDWFPSVTSAPRIMSSSRSIFCSLISTFLTSALLFLPPFLLFFSCLAAGEDRWYLEATSLQWGEMPLHEGLFIQSHFSKAVGRNHLHSSPQRKAQMARLNSAIKLGGY